MGRRGYPQVPQSRFRQEGGEQQSFCHIGAGAVDAQIGDSQLPYSKGGADALVEQVPGQQAVEVRIGEPGFFHRQFHSVMVQTAFSPFPALLTKGAVRVNGVKEFSQRAFAFPFGADGGKAPDRRRMLEQIGLFSAFECQTVFLLSKPDRTGTGSVHTAPKR